jgi:hypothetical protein
MFQPIIDTATGAIRLNDGFSWNPETREEELVKHFGVSMDEEPKRKQGSAHYFYYFIKDVAIGDWKVNLNLSFYEYRLTIVSMYPQISADSFPHLNTNRTGYGPSEFEYAVLELCENWLTEQLKEQRKFDWGSIEAIFAKRPDGPGAPLIYLNYYH